MLLLPHTVIGGTISALIPNPFIGLPLSLISHFLADLVPHWNPHISQEMKQYHHLLPQTKKLIIIDAFISLFVGLAIAFLFTSDFYRRIIIIGGCFLGVLPDFFESPYFFLGIKNRYLEMLMKFQKKLQFNWPLPWGLVPQSVITILCLWLLFK